MLYLPFDYWKGKIILHMIYSNENIIFGAYMICGIYALSILHIHHFKLPIQFGVTVSLHAHGEHLANYVYTN